MNFFSKIYGGNEKKIRLFGVFSRACEAKEGSPPPTQDPTWAQKLLASLPQKPQKPPKANLPFLQWILHSHKVVLSPQPSERWTLLHNLQHYRDKSLCYVHENYIPFFSRFGTLVLLPEGKNPSGPHEAGEDNPQAREEESKLY